MWLLNDFTVRSGKKSLISSLNHESAFMGVMWEVTWIIWRRCRDEVTERQFGSDIMRTGRFIVGNLTRDGLKSMLISEPAYWDRRSLLRFWINLFCGFYSHLSKQQRAHSVEWASDWGFVVLMSWTLSDVIFEYRYE